MRGLSRGSRRCRSADRRRFPRPPAATTAASSPGGREAATRLPRRALTLNSPPVLVIMTGVVRLPDSSIHAVPADDLAVAVEREVAGENTGGIALSARDDCGYAGPDRPASDDELAEPRMIVVCPTSTPATSVIDISGPGTPSNGIPNSRARGVTALPCIRRHREKS